MNRHDSLIALDRDRMVFDRHESRLATSVGRVPMLIAEQIISERIIGESTAIRRVREQIARVAPLDLPVLIQGPTGSGKELVARALHAVSHRSGRFVAFNVCAIPEPLFEATLFGHVKGAYTGAIASTTGHLADADRGTAFADEISGLPLALQSKLLRAVELREYQPVGASIDRRSDFRLVSATNENLPSLVATGRFRSDLAERLSTIVIDVPPLADRREDIGMLVRHFVSRAAASAFGRDLTFDEDAMHTLQAYDWPRNVRELRNVVERICAFANGSIITAAEIVAAMGRPGGEQAAVAMQARDEAERRRLLAMLAEADWDTARVAELLGIHRATVYRRMQRLGISASRMR